MIFYTLMNGETYCADCYKEVADPLDRYEELYVAVEHDYLDNPTTSPCDHCTCFQWELV